MNTHNIILLSLLILISLNGCEDVIVINSLDRAIVQAYLYAGAPVNDIRLNQPLSFGVEEDSTGPPINDANILLTHAGEAYALVASPGDSGYYHYPGDDLDIREGESYSISFEHRGIQVSAETLVPPPPTNLAIAQEQFQIAPITVRQQLQSLLGLPPIELTWEYEGEQYYYLLIENTTENPEDIVQLQGGGGPGGGGNPGNQLRRRFSFISIPFQENTYAIQIASLTQYGLHRIVLFRINQEYADLYETLDQDSRNLSEPLNNIQNGLGIFTAFNSDTVWLDVQKP